MKHRIDNKLLYCLITLLCLLILLLFFEASNGDYVSDFFFNNYFGDFDYFQRDSGMDFFHSLEYIKGSDPYGTFHTLYPPLANAFFLFIYGTIPESVTDNWAGTFESSKSLRGTSSDLRTFQAPMVAFIIFIIICVIGLIYVTLLVLHNEKHAFSVAVCIVFSYGILYAFERGNIIIFSIILSILFLALYNDENPVKREISLICLALAFGLKLYPALFGCILLIEKRYKEAVRAVIYGLSAIILPFFLFKNGLGNFELWLEAIISYSGGTSYSNADSIKTIINMFVTGINTITDLTIPNYIAGIVSYIIIATILASAFFSRKKTHRILILTYAVILISEQSAYIYGFFIIPLLFMLRESYESKTENIITMLTILLVSPLPYFNPSLRNDFIDCLIIIQAVLLIYDRFGNTHFISATGNQLK